MVDFSIFHPEAEEEILERAAYQRENFPELVDEWFLTLESAADSILEDPLRHREHEFGHRRVNLGKFPHYLVYLIRDDKVWFVALGSDSQDPFYWRHRLGTTQPDRN